MGRPASQELKEHAHENPRYARELFAMIKALYSTQSEAAEWLEVSESALSQIKTGALPARPHWKKMLQLVAISQKPEIVWATIVESSPSAQPEPEPEPEWAADVLAAVHSVRAEDREKLVALVRGIAGIAARETTSYRKRGAA